MPLALRAAHARTPLFLNAYAWFASTGTLAVFGLLYWILAARYYSPEAIGLSSAAISILIFLSGLGHVQVMNVVVRFVPRAGQASRRLIGYAYLFGICLSGVIGLIFIAGLGWWAPALGFLNANRTVALNFVLATIAWCVFTLEDYVLTGLRQAVWVPVANILYTLAKLALLVLLATPLPQYGILVSWLLPAVVVLVPVNWLIFKRLIPKHEQATEADATPIVLSQLIRYAAGNSIGAMFSLATVRLLPLIVAQAIGAVQGAYFFIPWTIATSLQFIITNMALSLTVEGVLDEARLGAYVRRFLSNTLRLIAPLVVLLVLGAPLLLRLSGEQYAAEGTPLLRLLVISAPAAMVNSIYISIARVRHQVTRVWTAQAVLSLLTLALSCAALPRYGIVGVGWAVLASESIVAGLLALGPRRRTVAAG